VTAPPSWTAPPTAAAGAHRCGTNYTDAASRCGPACPGGYACAHAHAPTHVDVHACVCACTATQTCRRAQQGAFQVQRGVPQLRRGLLRQRRLQRASHRSTAPTPPGSPDPLLAAAARPNGWFCASSRDSLQAPATAPPARPATAPQLAYNDTWCGPPRPNMARCAVLLLRTARCVATRRVALQPGASAAASMVTALGGRTGAARSARTRRCWWTRATTSRRSACPSARRSGPAGGRPGRVRSGNPTHSSAEPVSGIRFGVGTGGRSGSRLVRNGHKHAVKVE
jgi:hypothetical protein